MTTTQGEYTKKAVMREPGYPIGQPAPLFLNCVCGHKLPIDEEENHCPECSRVYSRSGWILRID